MRRGEKYAARGFAIRAIHECVNVLDKLGNITLTGGGGGDDGWRWRVAKSLKITLLNMVQEGWTSNDYAGTGRGPREIYTADIPFDVNRYLCSC